MNTLTDDNLITALDLNNQVDQKGNPILHFLYGSQLYGTLFGIYGQFLFAQGTESSNQRVIIGLKLELLNYRGVVNIGFTDEMPVYLKGPTTSSESKIMIGVQALSLKNQLTIDINPYIEINKGDRHTVTFLRVLYPLAQFAPSASVTNTGTPSGTVPQTAVFDTEFAARDGVDFFQNPLRPGMAGYQGLTLQSFSANKQFASPRCSQSIVNLSF